MGIIDTHAHVYDVSAYSDTVGLINNLKEFGVTNVLLPGTNLDDDIHIRKLVSLDSRLFSPMIGIHPDHIDHSYKSKVSEIEKYLMNYDYIGIGEIGLDYYNNHDNIKEQKLFLDMVLDVAISAKLPISIHSRNSFEDVYNTLSKKNDISGVIHCFTGDLSEARRYIDLGFYLGIGGILTFKKSRLKDVLVKIPLSYIVLETDSPFLSPEPVRGSINTPCNLVYIVDYLARLYNVDRDEVINCTSENARNIFKIN